MLIPTPTSGDISLYFHLPFCHKKCDYCHFYVLPNKDEYKSLLLKSLLLEIDQKKALFNHKKIQSVYFGGGTPALAGPHFIEKILEALRPHLHNEIEITLEVNPENYDLTALRSFHQIGVNRLSLGVQSFDDDMLIRLGRTHSSKDVEKALENAKKAAFNNISIDLMYDLPDQTLTEWRHTLEKAIQSDTTHISLYNLSIEPHTVFYKYRDKIKARMPKASLSIEMFEEAKSQFEKVSYSHYEISAFCKEDYYSKHNTGYWLQRPHLGFGPSAFSFYEGARFQNISNLHKYSRKIKANEEATDFKEQLSNDLHLKESLALHLRLLHGFDIASFEERFGLIPTTLSKTLQKLVEKKLLIKDQKRLRLSNKGLLFHDDIASEII